MQATRQEILDYLRQHGDATVKDLSRVLSLTATGVRQHLGVLERDSLVSVRESRGKVGRPALVYALTSSGYALFPNRYDELANLLLDEIRTLAGSKGLQSVLMRVASRSAEPYLPQLKGLSLEQRVEQTTEILNQRGCMADCQSNGAGEFLINQYVCPFPNVARGHSSVCAQDVEFISQLTGGNARLVRSLLRGDQCCTYRVRPAAGD